VHLKIRHRADTALVAVSVFADRVGLHWPGGQLTKPAWDRALADILKPFWTARI
jgi:hypothetical protein